MLCIELILIKIGFVTNLSKLLQIGLRTIVHLTEALLAILKF